MERYICSYCGEKLNESDHIEYCPYCDTIFVSVEDVKNDMLVDSNIYES
jgi:rubrerythrin